MPLLLPLQQLVDQSRDFDINDDELIIWVFRVEIELKIWIDGK